MTEIAELLVANMKRHRKRLGLSQFALAEMLDVSPDTIAKIESGQRFPSEKTLDKLTSVFDIKPYQLFIEDEEPFDKTKFVDKIYPLIVNDIKKRLKS